MNFANTEISVMPNDEESVFDSMKEHNFIGLEPEIMKSISCWALTCLDDSRHDLDENESKVIQNSLKI